MSWQPFYLMHIMLLCTRSGSPRQDRDKSPSSGPLPVYERLAVLPGRPSPAWGPPSSHGYQQPSSEQPQVGSRYAEATLFRCLPRAVRRRALRSAPVPVRGAHLRQVRDGQHTRNLRIHTRARRFMVLGGTYRLAVSRSLPHTMYHSATGIVTTSTTLPKRVLHRLKKNV